MLRTSISVPPCDRPDLHIANSEYQDENPQRARYPDNRPSFLAVDDLVVLNLRTISEHFFHLEPLDLVPRQMGEVVFVPFVRPIRRRLARAFGPRINCACFVNTTRLIKCSRKRGGVR